MRYINRQEPRTHTPCFSLSLPQHLCSCSSTRLQRRKKEWPSPENGKPRTRRGTRLSASCWVRQTESGALGFHVTISVLCDCLDSRLTFAFTNSHYSCFSRTLGIPDEIIEKGRDYKLITEVTQDGNDFSWTQIYPANASVTNKFTIDKECDMETIGGKKFKVQEAEDPEFLLKPYFILHFHLCEAHREGIMNVPRFPD